MSIIEFPEPLKELLEESNLQAPLRALADRVGEILADNKLPFFPDYTDHGVDHINRVLECEVELIPEEIWGTGGHQKTRLLTDADATVIIGSALLHDLGMHLRASGFLELISKNSRFRPVPWFTKSHDEYSGDRPWNNLWEDYNNEARRFSERSLANIIGEESARIWKFNGLPADIGQWKTNHYLIVGEFIRRHHERLAHEIALNGFPGLPGGWREGQFPAMGEKNGQLEPLADLIGLAARSHRVSLRVCQAYIESSPRYSRTPRPMGTAVLYPMALLRVSDSLQIDRQRAPLALLNLRHPQSPISIREWSKHQAVQHIGPASDPRAKMVTISSDISLSLYLQLEKLLLKLQSEIDHSTAVLDEFYGTRDDLALDKLNLTLRRVYSNLNTPAFRDSLPYIASRTGLSSDPNLLTLLVEPLYGKAPGVGVRELIQNAVDAVRELEVWCAAEKREIDSVSPCTEGCDVLIEFEKQEDGSWVLSVRDRGIGMSSDTIQNYFLRAGASFRQSPEWARDFVDQQGLPRVIRAGRFGVGAFAIFLLGPSFELWTRHAGASELGGYFVEVSVGSRLIEIRRTEKPLPVGTTIKVKLNEEAAESLHLDDPENGRLYYRHELRDNIDWFCWDWPRVLIRKRSSAGDETIEQQYSLPIRHLPPTWSSFDAEGFDKIYWTYNEAPRVTCNGLKIATPKTDEGFHYADEARFAWPETLDLVSPNIAVTDSQANLALNVQRYRLSNPSLPFTDKLVRDVAFSFVAHALVYGPRGQRAAFSSREYHPLHKDIGWSPHRRDDREGDEPMSTPRLTWCATSEFLIPADYWFCSLLKADSFLVCGTLAVEMSQGVIGQPKRRLATSSSAIMPWYGWLGLSRGRTNDMPDYTREVLKRLQESRRFMGHEIISSDILAAISQEAVPHIDIRVLELKAPGRTSWEVKEKRFGPWLRVAIGDEARTRVLEHAFQAVIASVRPHGTAVCFARSLKIRQDSCSPKSPIERVWAECLGARAIPFDPVARENLIADGSQHPELARHLEAWMKLKRNSEKRE
jgi:molecular chaperone HtpG